MILCATYVRKTGLFMLAIIVGLAAAIAIGWWQVDGPGVDRLVNKPNAVISPIESMSFSLIDHEGASVGPELLLDRPSMVFFGYTFCPDVCPTTLADISGWLEDLGPGAERLNVVFISVDPERDTPEAMADYVSAFHPKIRGWTGSPDDVARAASAFRVAYKKVPLDDGGYSMDHTASVILFDATGQFRSTIDFHEPREIAVPKIRRVLRDS
jgi:protein SCO1/2